MTFTLWTGTHSIDRRDPESKEYIPCPYSVSGVEYTDNIHDLFRHINFEKVVVDRHYDKSTCVNSEAPSHPVVSIMEVSPTKSVI